MITSRPHRSVARRRRSRRCKACACATLTLTLLSSCGDGNGSEGTDELRVAPNAPAPAAWAHLWLADEMGCYEQEDLEVEIVDNLPGGAVENALTSGQLDFGGSNSSRLIPHGDAMGDESLQMFMPESKYLFRMIVLEDSDIQTAQDLVGKTIGVPEPGGDEDTAKLLMGVEGIDAADFELLAVGGDAAAGVALDNGSVDAFSGSMGDLFVMQGADIPVRTIPMGDTENFYNSGYTATQETIEDRRDVAVRFGRALAKAMIFEYENPEAAIDALGRIAPEATQDRERAAAIMALTHEINLPMYEARNETDPALWQTMIDAYHDTGIIEESFPPETIVNDELLDDIWDFDIEAVVAAARAGEAIC